MLKAQTKTYDCDVLVIGGGLAGTWAAITAKDFTDNVILVDKAKVAKSGCSTFAAGVMLAPQNYDDLDVWLKEIAEKGNYINDQDWIEILLREQIKIIDELQKWGVEFEKDEKGKLVRIIGRGHVNTRMIMFHGSQFMATMRKKVIKRRVAVVERVMITDLLTSDGEYPTKGSVVGAVGFNVRSGEMQVFKAKSVILASGGIWGKHWGGRNIMGEGIAMGFRTGAELHGMEFAMPLDGWVFDRKYKTGQGLNMWQSAGMHLVNSLGERFMEKYEPVLKERARLAELVLGLAKECVEGRGPVYMDMRHFNPETWDRIRRVTPRGMHLFDTLKPWKRKVQFDFGAGALNALLSGIKNNTFCETNLPGLYVAGQVGGYMVHGTFSVGGVCLATCCVSGRRAGEYASKYGKLCGEVKINQAQLDGTEKAMYQFLLVKDGVTPGEMHAKINEVAAVPYALFRTDKNLHKLLDGLSKVKAMLPKLYAQDYHELVSANEIKDYLLCMELIYKAALERKETRGPHSRADYPHRDDINWLKRVVLCSDGDGKIRIRLEPIPLYRYPAKPEKLGLVPPVVPPASIK